MGLEAAAAWVESKGIAAVARSVATEHSADAGANPHNFNGKKITKMLENCRRENSEFFIEQILPLLEVGGGESYDRAVKAARGWVHDQLVLYT